MTKKFNVVITSPNSLEINVKSNAGDNLSINEILDYIKDFLNKKINSLKDSEVLKNKLIEKLNKLKDIILKNSEKVSVIFDIDLSGGQLIVSIWVNGGRI